MRAATVRGANQPCKTLSEIQQSHFTFLCWLFAILITFFCFLAFGEDKSCRIMVGFFKLLFSLGGWLARLEHGANKIFIFFLSSA